MAFSSAFNPPNILDPYKRGNPFDRTPEGVKKEKEIRDRLANVIHNQARASTTFDQLHDPLASGNMEPLTYDDLVRMQQQMLGQTTARGVVGIAKEELGEHVRKWLSQYHPDEEAFLHFFANQRGLSPLDAIVECIQVTKKYGRHGEPPTLNKINDELHQLEKEKHES